VDIIISDLKVTVTITYVGGGVKVKKPGQEVVMGWANDDCANDDCANDCPNDNANDRANGCPNGCESGCANGDCSTVKENAFHGCANGSYWQNGYAPGEPFSPGKEQNGRENLVLITYQPEIEQG
jgi:hypothetical protein